MRDWAKGLVLAGAACFATGALRCEAQTRQQGTLQIDGRSEQAPLLRINGKSYVDLESLARMLHATMRFDGSRTILALPGAASSGDGAAAGAEKSDRLTQGFLDAEIQALRVIREWHAALVSAVQKSNPITETVMGPLQRSAEAQVQLATAAASSQGDRNAGGLLNNELASMRQISDQLLQLHAQAAVIAPDFLNGNALDAKIQGCDQALTSMVGTKQYQDDARCH